LFVPPGPDGCEKAKEPVPKTSPAMISAKMPDDAFTNSETPTNEMHSTY